MPMLSAVPFFINAPQFDEFELMYDTDNYAPATPAQYAFVEEFQTGTLALIRSLPPGTGVFSPTCLVHCLSGQATFTQLNVAGTTFEQALSGWYFGTSSNVQAVSDCTGWQCTSQCGVSAQTGLPCNAGTASCDPIQLATDAGGAQQQQPQPEQQQQQQQTQQAADVTDAATAVAQVSQTEPSLTAAQNAALAQQIACQQQVAEIQAAANEQASDGQQYAAAQLNANAAQQAAQCQAQQAQAQAQQAAQAAQAQLQQEAAARSSGRRRLLSDAETSRRLLAAAPTACCGG
jgi:hypothetical protein